MGTQLIDKYFSPELRKDFLKWFNISNSFLVFYSIIFPTFALLSGIVFVCRVFLSLFYKFYYDGKYKLASASDALYSFEKEGNTLTMNGVTIVKGQTDIDKWRELWLNEILAGKNDVENSNQKLMWRLVKKYGFFTWEDTRENFDISEHVKLCPGISENNILTEDEMMEAVSKLTDKVINSGTERPQWEFLLVPKFTRGRSKDLHYAFIFRVYHAYMDGVSAMQLVKNKMLNSEAKFVLDPVNPPIKMPTKLELAGLYAQTIFFGPYTLYKLTQLKRNNIFQEMKESSGPKFLTLSKMEMNMEDVKLIRKKFKCSTTALFNSLMSGVLSKAAKRKGFSVPDVIDSSYTVALLPYPNHHPQNRFAVPFIKSHLGCTDPVKRLRKLNEEMKHIAAYDLTTLSWMGEFVGYCPVWIHEKFMERITCGYVVTNLPGYVDRVYTKDCPVEYICGCPPIKNGVGFGVGISSYNGKINVLWMVEKTRIITSRTDVNFLVADFEKEFLHLKNLATADYELNNN